MVVGVGCRVRVSWVSVPGLLFVLLLIATSLLGLMWTASWALVLLVIVVGCRKCMLVRVIGVGRFVVVSALSTSLMTLALGSSVRFRVAWRLLIS